MKCVTCKEEKEEAEFNWRNKSRGQRKLYCRVCDRATKKRFYERNRAQVISEVLERRSTIREQFNEWKKTLKCRMCGESDVACLDFHHIDPTQKEHNVSKLLNHNSIKKVVNELKKCICVCRNCHAKIHYYNLNITQAGEVFMDTRKSSKLE